MKQLIKKYNDYYIQFDFEGLVCHLKITEKEKEEILQDENKLDKILTSYKKILPWTKEHFMFTFLLDYFKNEENLDYVTIDQKLRKLNKEEKLELYQRVQKIPYLYYQL